MALFALIPYDGKKSVEIEVDADTDLRTELKSAIRGRFEEYEVELVDGTAEEVDIWNAIKDHYYGGLEKFVDVLNQLEHLWAGICYALENRITDNVEAAVEFAQDGGLREGDLQELAAEFIDEGIIDRADYFDIQSFGADLANGGDLPEEAYDEDGNLEWDHEDVQQYAQDLVDDIGVENITGDYVDYDAVVRDLQHDYDEFDFAGTTYTIFTAQ